MNRFGKPFLILIAACVAIALGPRASLGQGIADPIPGPIPVGDVEIGFETIASGLVAPVYGIHANDGYRQPDHLDLQL